MYVPNMLYQILSQIKCEQEHFTYNRYLIISSIIWEINYTSYIHNFTVLIILTYKNSDIIQQIQAGFLEV